ncbi:hypothetical protein [Kitasatospora sp. CB01950]|uniref:hypothetical protein n=1 Tax=Kitasatospora sp. CB01950 TaxID=1703930 RepID=UPI0013012FAF|nr:hypothetical protein [Kitasatospora sp. CB01950]
MTSTAHIDRDAIRAAADRLLDGIPLRSVELDRVTAERDQLLDDIRAISQAPSGRPVY